MELLNMLDTAAYSVQLSSFVSMSSPKDHCSHCQFLSTIFKHLGQNQLFNMRACWWSPACVETSKATVDVWPWLLITDSTIHNSMKSHSPLLLSTSQLWVLTQIFELISGLCRYLNKDWGRSFWILFPKELHSVACAEWLNDTSLAWKILKPFFILYFLTYLTVLLSIMFFGGLFCLLPDFVFAILAWPSLKMGLPG